MKAHLRQTFTLTALSTALFVSGCGWQVQEVAPNRLDNAIRRGGVVLPAGTTALEGTWRRSHMHGSCLLLKLAMNPDAYRKLRADTKFTSIISSRESSDKEILAKVPLVLRERWVIKRAGRQVLEAGDSFAMSFAALVETDDAATVYFFQFY